ncbi:hypothetical protein [Arthrobacter livingstonensis]|uniref:hypothetical protein n=1 Tax=Arthrobacter livingstonensis TaxID=670078 RepID=UPI001B870BAB|nr:hypothetical protein [Arthrobacter livingstonensis]
MMLTPCSDVSDADWLTAAELPCQQLVSFGPSAFPAHSRVRFLPDPAYECLSENDADAEGVLSETGVLQAVLTVLASHTSTQVDCHFAFWDGWAQELDGPRVAVPNRSYFLFHGSVAEPLEWDIPSSGRPSPRQWTPDPAFVWAADHAWCVANDVDPHWAGIGAGVGAINGLLADPRLDVVVADPAGEQPSYR